MTVPKASKFLKKAWADVRSVTSVIIVSAVIALAPSSSQAAEAKAAPPPSKTIKASDQSMSYDVYAGGFHVVSANLDVDLAKKDSYLLRLAAYTHGMLAKLAPWKGEFKTNGWYNPKTASPQPKLHQSDTVWRDEREVTQFHYNKDGSFKQYHIQNEDENRVKPPEPPSLAEDSTDVLSSTLKVMNKIAAGGKCEGTDKIFDGSRSYNLVFHEQNKVDMKATDLNVYAGPATECTVEVKPIAGKWHDKPRGWMSIQEQGREKGTMPTIWFAQMAPNEPAVPVKIRVKTDYGTLFMHLTGYKGAGKNLQLASQ